MEKYAVSENISKVFPYTDILPDEEVKKMLEEEIKKEFPDCIFTEWKVHEVPLGFGRKIITCKFITKEQT